MKKIFLPVIGIILPFLGFGQSPVLKGTVYNASNGKPLENVNILVDGKPAGVSDNEGSFSLECHPDMKVKISGVGFTSFETKISNCDTTLKISLVPGTTVLNEVEITATTPVNKSILYQPASIAKLGQTEIRRQTGLFLDDAINTTVPGVYMQRRTVSAGQQFNIRGYGNGARGTNGVNSNFDTQGTKVYLNNIPVTDAEGITLMDDIDFGSVENVEVLKGPSGTLYGLAIAGVVNLKTKMAAPGKVSVGQDVMLGSYGLERFTSHIEIGGQNSSLLINYGKQNYDGFMVHTASHKDFVNVVGDIRANEKQSFSAYLGYSDSYDERNGELTIGQYDTLDFSGNPRYIKNNAHSEVKTFRAGLSHIYKITSWLSNTSTVFGTGSNSNVSSAGGWTDKLPVNYGFRSTFDMAFFSGKKISLSGITGIEMQSQLASTIGYTMVPQNADPLGYNIIGTQRSNQATESTTYSYFTEWNITLPYELSVTAGVGVSNMELELNDRMYDPAQNKNGSSQPTRYRASYNGLVSPHAAINKVISKQLSVYASYSKGYKAPVSSYFFIPTTGEVNRGLKPETGTQYEAGTKGSLFNNRLKYQVALFQAVFSDKMTAVAVPLNSTTTAYSYIANGGSLDNKGLEALVSYDIIQSSNPGLLSILRPFANLAYSDFKYDDFRFETLSPNRKEVVVNDYSGKVVAGVPPVTANAGVDFAFKFGLYGNVTHSYRDPMFITSDNVFRTNGYNLLNGKIGFRTTLLNHLDLDVFAGAINITSQKYYSMVFINQLPDAYIPAPREINYFGGINLKYTF